MLAIIVLFYGVSALTRGSKSLNCFPQHLHSEQLPAGPRTQATGGPNPIKQCVKQVTVLREVGQEQLSKEEKVSKG